MGGKIKKIPKKYVEPYYKILNKIKPKIGLKKEIGIKIMNGFHFDLSDKERYVIGCPPYFKMFEPLFVHYLVHAKMLEDGWPSPEIDYQLTDKAFETASITKQQFDAKPIEEKDRINFGLHNRSTDSFFDFYVWNYVCQNVDQRYFLDFTGETVKQSAKDIVKGFKKMYQEKGFKLHGFVICIDWFVMFYMVSKNINHQRAQELNALYHKLFKNKRFLELVPPNTKETIDWLRTFYQQLYLKYPTYQELIKNSAMQKEFTKSYYRIWKDSGFKVKIKTFV